MLPSRREFYSYFSADFAWVGVVDIDIHIIHRYIYWNGDAEEQIRTCHTWGTTIGVTL